MRGISPGLPRVSRERDEGPRSRTATQRKWRFVRVCPATELVKHAPRSDVARVGPNSVRRSKSGVSDRHPRVFSRAAPLIRPVNRFLHGLL